MLAQAHRQDAGATARLASLLFFSRPDEGCVLADAIEDLGASIAVDRNQEIFCEQEPAGYFYKLTTGLVRTCRFLVDGRRQINSFHFPGETFGFTSGAVHGLSAEAAEPCKLIVVKRQVLASAAARDGELAAALLNSATNELRKAQEHVVLLGKGNATERIVAFLRSLACNGTASDILDIPMSRQDIADYLGLTIETVSRTMTLLEGSGLIALETSRRLRMRRVM
ncbi:MAG: helix-turn-helix domain-containing protein [Pseudaminobacter sp.]